MFGEFELEMPGNLAAALALLDDGKGGAVLAGGSNLMLDLRARRVRPDRVISLDRLDELRGIAATGNHITLGARVSVADILAAPDLPGFAPSLIEAANLFAGQMVRNTGTVGGNIACASPAADLVVPLVALDADITLTSVRGARKVALADYYTGYKQDVRAADELITAVSWARPAPNSANRFYKLARRVGDAITVTGVAVNLTIDAATCTKARIALGAVAPTIIRARKAEAMLQGQTLTDTRIAEAAKQARAETSPIDDVRASADYRSHTTEMLVRRLLTQIRDQL